jgi:cytochrome c553
MLSFLSVALFYPQTRIIGLLDIHFEGESMKLNTVVASLVLALAMFIFPNITLAAQDAATIYTAKCAACHGVDGLASTPIAKKQNVPSFADAKVQKTSNADLQGVILSGGTQKRASHAYASKGISNEDATKLAIYIKELGKKK